MGERAFTLEPQWVYEGRCTDVGPRYGFARAEGLHVESTPMMASERQS